MDSAVPRAAPCYELHDRPAHLRERYARIALISLPRHLQAVDAGGAETLFVCHGWLLWHQALAQGLHAVQYEAESWLQPPSSDNSDIYVRTHDWIYLDGRDVTMFRGVSLGRRIGREVSLLLMERDRLRHALELLIARYAPHEMIFLDFRCEYGVMDTEARIRVVRDSCRRHGVGFLDQRDPATLDDRALPFMQAYSGLSKGEQRAASSLRKFMRRTAEVLFVGASTVMRRFRRDRPAVLLASTHLTSRPLIEAFEGSHISAYVLASWYPRITDVRQLLRGLAKGIYLVDAAARLSRDDLTALAVIEHELEAKWSRLPEESFETQIARYVRREILLPKRLHDLARDVKFAEALLRRHRPLLVYSDGMDFYLCHIFFIVAKRLGLRTAVTWHGPFIQDVRMDILGGDARVRPVVDWFFTWGSINEAWLARNAPGLPTVRTGNPIVRRFERAVESGNAVVPNPPEAHVLLLACAGPVEDHRFVQAAQFPFFVKVVRTLRELGYREIRLKVHPGPYSKDYYADVARHFGISCGIYRDEPFRDLADWADIVIGPAGSGAMAEVLALGKPYYPVQLLPTALDLGYLGDLRIYGTAEAVCEAIADSAAGGLERALDDLTSVREIADPARRTWSVIAAHMGVATASGVNVSKLRNKECHPY